MITLTGNRVFQDELGAPSLEDIAVGLGRIPRFVGQTYRWWPVLLHSFVCREIARRDWADRVQLLMLLHDAHECVTGDCPRTWKTKEMKEQQRKLDIRIFASLGVHLPTSDEEAIVSAIDNRALIAEATVLAPQCVSQIVNEGCHLHHPDLDIVHRVKDWHKQPDETDGREAPAVYFYILEVKKLLLKVPMASKL